MGFFKEKRKLSCRPDPENPQIVHCEKFSENKDGTRVVDATADFAFDGLCNKQLIHLEGDPNSLEEMDKETTRFFKCKAKNTSNTQKGRPEDY